MYVDVGTNPGPGHDSHALRPGPEEPPREGHARPDPHLAILSSRRSTRATSSEIFATLLRSESWFKADDFYGNALVTGQLRGKQLALPLDLAIEAIFYNQQAFAAAKVAPPQPGWTWDQFLAAAQSLTTNRSEDTTGRWGCQIIPFFPGFETMGWQRDAKVVGDDGASLDLTERGRPRGCSSSRTSS